MNLTLRLGDSKYHTRGKRKSIKKHDHEELKHLSISHSVKLQFISILSGLRLE